MANVFIVSGEDAEVAEFWPIAYVIVGNGGRAWGGCGIWTASWYTTVFLERFSMVVVFTSANWSELPVIPAVKSPKSAARATVTIQ